MKNKSLALLILMATTYGMFAQESDIPAEILTYIKTAGVTEDGLPGGTEAEAEAFIDYLETDWKTVASLIGTGMEDREQALIFSAAEFLAPETYLSFTSEALRLFENGKVSQAPIENLISGQTRKDGFLYANSKDERTKQILLRASKALPDSSRVAREIDDALAGNVAGQIARQRAMNGLPVLETLRPEDPLGRQNSEGPSSEPIVGDQREASDSPIQTKGKDSKSPTLPKWPLVLGAIAVLSILVLLIRAFLRGRAS